MSSSRNSIDVQPRDLHCMRALYECRVMTLAHAAAMFFDDKREYTKKRLQKLKASGLVGERRRGLNERALLFLTRKGYSVLRERGELEGYPSLSKNAFEGRTRVSDLTIRHELAVMDVKAAIYHAVRASETFTINEFTTWPLLNEFKVSSHPYGLELPVQPDGFLKLHEKEIGTKGYTHSFFLEIDRSSENQMALIENASCYQQYFRSGGFCMRNGGKPDEIDDFPFRVLIIFKTATRRNNTAELLVAHTPPILRIAWLTTFSEILTDPLGPIWIVPADYRTVVKGTRFEGQTVKRAFEYRHDTERESFIESTIQKRSLLDD